MNSFLGRFFDLASDLSLISFHTHVLDLVKEFEKN